MKTKRVRKDNPSKSNAKANAAFFAFVTFAAILSVAILGYLRFSDSGKAVIGVETKNHRHKAQSTEPQLTTQEKITKGIDDKLPEARNSMAFPSAEEIKGKWYTSVGPSGIAEIDFSDDGYELVYVQSPQDRLRHFSKGIYTYNPSIGYLDLQPVRDAEPTVQSSAIDYKMITTRKYRMNVFNKDGDPALYIAAQDHDVIGKTYHPIFMYDDYAGAPVLRFKPLKAQEQKAPDAGK